MLEELLVELENPYSRVFVCFFEGAFVRPVYVAVGVFALHPVAELLVAAC